MDLELASLQPSQNASDLKNSVIGLSGIVKSLENRVQTMNNDLVKIDALMSYALGVRPNVDRIAAKDGKEDARKD